MTFNSPVPMEPGIIANIERDGKYVFGTLTAGEHKVYERIPVHVMHLSEEEQMPIFRDCLLRLRRKLAKVMSGKEDAYTPVGAEKLASGDNA